jgi:hypothetical protein
MLHATKRFLLVACEVLADEIGYRRREPLRRGAPIALKATFNHTLLDTLRDVS